MSLASIERIIISELMGKEFWGEIDFSVDEYNQLRQRIKEILQQIDITKVAKNFPIALTTLMVFMMRYKYNDNFWGLLEEELGNSLRQFDSGMLGDCARETFEKYGFNYDAVKDETRVNIEPLMYEACLPPVSSLDTLFYLLNYDKKRGFDPQLMIEELINMRSYSIRKPLLHFLKRFQDDRAIDFLLEVHDAMISVDQMMDNDSQYIESYNLWKEKENTKEVIASRKKQENQARPYLSFEDGGKGLVIVLPYTIMKDEWIEEARWNVRSKNGFKRSVDCSVRASGGKRFIDSFSIPVIPDNEYYVSLEDTENLDLEKNSEIKIFGVSNRYGLVFNSTGRLVHSNYIQVPYGIVILPTTLDIKSENCTIDYQSYPTENKDFKILTITPLGQDSKVELISGSTSTSFISRPQVNIELEGKTLFSVSTDDCNAMFVETPLVRVHFDGIFIKNLLKFRIGSHEFPIENLYNDECLIDTRKLPIDVFDKYGTYNVRIYQGTKFLRQTEFSYVPNIETNCSTRLSWLDDVDRNKKRIFKFKKVDDWELEFSNCIVRLDSCDYLVECPSNIGTIQGTIKRHKDSFTFEKSFEIPIRPLEAKIINANGDEEFNATDKPFKLGLSKFDEKELWLTIKTFGEYKESKYNVRLVSQNGTEQVTELKINQAGYGNLKLALFFDTLNACPLPAKIELYCNSEGGKKVPLVMITEELPFNVRPVFTKKRDYLVLSIKDDGKDVILKKFGKEKVILNLLYSISILDKSGKCRGYKFPYQLGTGIYTVTSGSHNACFELGGEEEVVPSLGNDTLFVKDQLDEGVQISSISKWLQKLILAFLKSGPNNSLIAELSLNETDYSQDIILSDKDIEIVVLLAYFYNDKIPTAKKEVINYFMQEINNKILSGNDRFRIIDFLVSIDSSKEVFEICEKQYSLMLFFVNCKNASQLSTQVEPYSLELSLMLLMESDASIRDTVGREKYRDLIGKEALISFMSVLTDSDAEKIEEQKKFLKEQLGCRVKIILNPEVAGDCNLIQGMIEYPKNKIKLNFAKKPDAGIYFDNIKYIDQYVNWYGNNWYDDIGIKPEVRDKMIQTIIDYFDTIVTALKDIRSGKYSSLIEAYDEGMKNRKRDNMNTTTTQLKISSPARFFYLEAMCAFLAKLPNTEGSMKRYKKLGNKFLISALEIAPRLSKRDILMAETFIYLKKKEEKLCR